MTKNPNLFRPALTAIAAVLVSTPLAVAAQTVTDDSSVPPAASPMTSPVTVPAPQPIIILDPVPEASPAFEPVAAPVKTTSPQATQAQPAPRRATQSAPVKSAPVARQTAPTRSNNVPEIAPPVAAAAAEPTVAPAMPVAIDAGSSESAAAPTPPAAKPAVAINDNALVTGGLVALGIFGLAGLAFSMRRRRSVNSAATDQAYEPERRVEAVPQPVAYTAPATAIAAAPALALSTRSGAATGSHVERAMRGPTPDNPFLTLRKRLARARFLDKREQSGSSRTGFGSFQPALA